MVTAIWLLLKAHHANFDRVLNPSPRRSEKRASESNLGDILSSSLFRVSLPNTDEGSSNPRPEAHSKRSNRSTAPLRSKTLKTTSILEGLPRFGNSQNVKISETSDALTAFRQRLCRFSRRNGVPRMRTVLRATLAARRRARPTHPRIPC